MRVFFTGGSGKAGRHAIPVLQAAGHEVTNIDLAPFPGPGVRTLHVDLADAGQVANAMVAYSDYADLDRGTGMRPYDAVVHFAAIPAILFRPDNETYRINVLSTYNVIDAAIRAGIRKVIVASSETTYGICFADGVVQPLYVPVDEEHPTVPPDSYAMSKVVNEVTARSFHQRTVNAGAPVDIYALRINNVIEPHEYLELAPSWREKPESRRRNVFAYIDARDLGHMVDRCLQTDGLGFQVFNVSNDDSSVGIASAEVTERFYPGVPQARPIEGHGTFYSSEKAKRMVGFAPRHGWRHLP
jgi:nucleoside-diphosphate-sugar epimerase